MLKTMTRLVDPDLQLLRARFMVKVRQRGEDSHWEWIGSMSKGRYGVMVYRGKLTSARIVGWKLWNDEADPLGRRIVPLCRVAWCINPNHLGPRR